MNILNAKAALKISLLAVAISTSMSSHADQVIQDDLIVVGSQCIGVDCVNGESFNFDTLRLKENNLRIKFIDTSSSSSFPTTDWQITINDSVNGGLNKFSIEDVDSNKVPFTILAAAPTNSLFVSSTGYIGFNTSTPMVNLHTVTGNTPTLRLEQDTSSGFSSQAWDVGGNETNFFIRDTTNNGQLPLRISANASNNSIFIANNGNVGFETSTPDGLFDIAHPSNANNHSLLVNPNGYLGVNIDNGFSPTGLFDVQTTGGSSRFKVATDGEVILGDGISRGGLEIKNGKMVVTNKLASLSEPAVTFQNPTTSSTHARLFELDNQGGSAFFTMNVNNTSSGVNEWNMQARHEDGSFRITTPDYSGEELTLSKDGNLTVNGDVIANGTTYASSKLLKENFEKIDAGQILSAISQLDISKWNYIKDSDNVKHIGPYAEDFYATFKLNGNNSTGISASDISGVSLAAIKALYDELVKVKAELAELKSNK